jgi:hypothetical protein
MLKFGAAIFKLIFKVLWNRFGKWLIWGFSSLYRSGDCMNVIECASRWAVSYRELDCLLLCVRSENHRYAYSLTMLYYMHIYGEN